MAPQFSSVDLAAGRFAAYGLVAAGVMLAGPRSRQFPTFRQAAAALAMSVLGFTGYYLLLVLAIRDAGAEVPTLVIGTIPIWVMVLGKPSRLRWGALVPGVLLTLAGLGLMMGSPQEPPVGAPPLQHWRGIVLAAASLACWTAFALFNSSWLKRHPQVNATDWANWLGVASGLGGVMLWLLAGSPASQLGAADGWPMFLLVCIATGLGSAWLATVLWNMASRRLSASLCGQLIISETLFALFYCFAWEARWPSFPQLAACVLFTLGILASIKAHQ